MDAYLRDLVAAVPASPPRSKLEPYYEVIRELRRKRCTYRQVAQFFTERLRIQVAPSTIHAFVAVRAKRGCKSAYELPPSEISETAAPIAETSQDPDPIAVLKQRRLASTPEPPRFEYAEDKPLELPATPSKKGF